MHQLLLLLTVVFVWISLERSVDIPCPVTVDIYSECSRVMFIWSSTYCWHFALIIFCPCVWQRGMTRRAFIENSLWNLLVPCGIITESHAWPVQVRHDAVWCQAHLGCSSQQKSKAAYANERSCSPAGRLNTPSLCVHTGITACRRDSPGAFPLFFTTRLLTVKCCGS